MNKKELVETLSKMRGYLSMYSHDLSYSKDPKDRANHEDLETTLWKLGCCIDDIKRCVSDDADLYR